MPRVRSAFVPPVLVVAITLLVGSLGGPSLARAQEKQAPADAPYLNPALPVAERVNDLISRMTLEEKASQMVNSAAAIPRLYVPRYDWWSEAAHGVAAAGTATNFPTTIGLGATWDTPLIHQVGRVVATEGRAKYHEAIRNDQHDRFYGLTFWAPNINIFRDPRWGRGQETYGEDPFLAGRMAVAFVTGVQGDDAKYLEAVSTPKHFAVHSGPEPLRHRFNVDVTPHDLEDTYLPAFRAAVVEGHAQSVMCAYNAIDDAPACASELLLSEHLRKYWGFDGYVVSDCGAIGDVTTGHHWTEDATHAAALSVKAGTDLECGNNGYHMLPEAVKQGLISEAELDTALRRLFTARFRLGMFDPPESYAFGRIPFSENNSATHRQLARQAEREAIVLLENDGILPLAKSAKRIAVIGPTAELVQAIQGNYNGTPPDPVTPAAGMVKRFGAARVVIAQGSTLADGLAIPIERSALHAGKAEGLEGEYFATPDLSGKPVLVRIDPTLNFNWAKAIPVPGLQRDNYAVRWTGTLTPPAPGDYRLNLRTGFGFRGARDTVRLWLDGQLLYDNSRFAMPSFGPPGARPAPTPANPTGAPPPTPPAPSAPSPANPTGAPPAASGPITPANPTGAAPAGGFRRFVFPDTVVHFADTKPHDVRIEYRHHTADAGIDLTWQPPAGVLQAEAVAAAQRADVVVAFLGLSPQLEGEEMPVSYEGFRGGDRTDIVLPKPQRDLLAALKATGKPVVLVLTSGSALAVDARQANAILEAWYPGEEGGNAIAETLAGDNNPAGRLPVTFYAAVDQLPPFEDYSMANRTYRYFTGKPWRGFGFGLSYSKFAYSGLKLPAQPVAAGDSVVVEVDVKNVSKVAGDEVVELYLTQPKQSLTPIRTLGAFSRVHLDPGQTVHVTLPLSARTLGQVRANGDRVIVPGEYQVAVGSTQPGESEGGLTGKFSVSGPEKTLPR